MKDFSVFVTSESNPDDLKIAIRSRLAHLDYLSAHDHLAMDELIRCIDDYHRRAQDLSKSGTVIKIEKMFQFSFAKIVVRLAVPDRRGFIQRLLDKARGNI